MIHILTMAMAFKLKASPFTPRPNGHHIRSNKLTYSPDRLPMLPLRISWLSLLGMSRSVIWDSLGLVPRLSSGGVISSSGTISLPPGSELCSGKIQCITSQKGAVGIWHTISFRKLEKLQFYISNKTSAGFCDA